MNHRKSITESSGNPEEPTENLLQNPLKVSHDAPAAIFDLEIFEELRDLLGDETCQEALAELSVDLQGIFPDMPAHRLDLGQVFDEAHSLVGRTSILGFTALRDASFALQKACMLHAQVDETYRRARKAAQAACNVLAVLQRKSV